MPNLLKMAKVQSILSLHAQGRSQREIARTLGVDRGTVRKYLLLGLSQAKPAIAPPGSTPAKPATPGIRPESANAPIGAGNSPGLSKPAIAPIRSPGPQRPTISTRFSLLVPSQAPALFRKSEAYALSKRNLPSLRRSLKAEAWRLSPIPPQIACGSFLPPNRMFK